MCAAVTTPAGPGPGLFGNPTADGCEIQFDLPQRPSSDSIPRLTTRKTRWFQPWFDFFRGACPDFAKSTANRSMAIPKRTAAPAMAQRAPLLRPVFCPALNETQLPRELTKHEKRKNFPALQTQWLSCCPVDSLQANPAKDQLRLPFF